MRHEDEIAACKKIKANGWKQGSLFLSSPKKLGQGLSNDESLYLLVTHSCDILHGSFADEPHAEAILVEVPDENKPNGNYTYGKNPRIMHLRAFKDGKECWKKVAVANKIIFERKMLAASKPSSLHNIENNDLRNLIDWVSKKYNRAAFPDEFNRRISKKSKDKIERSFKKDGHDILGLLVHLDSDDELSEEQDYGMKIHLVINNGEDFEKFSEMLESIVKNIRSNPGIEVLMYDVGTLSEMVVEDFFEMEHWDFDYLSYSNKPGGERIRRK